MSGARAKEERDLLAAEHALGLLEGDEARRARLLAASDPDFAGQVAQWEARLAPLADEIRSAAPDPRLRDRILAAVAAKPRDGDNIVVLRRNLRRWRVLAGAMTAVAASLGLLFVAPVTQAPPVAPPAQPAPMLVASLASAEGSASLTIAYDSRRASLTIMPGRVGAARGHDHQLWIIPAGAAPISIGVVHLDAPRHMAMPPAMARHFHPSATLAVSVEPMGGSPTGQPTGPVIASGPLVTI